MSRYIMLYLIICYTSHYIPLLYLKYPIISHHIKDRISPKIHSRRGAGGGWGPPSHFPTVSYAAGTLHVEYVERGTEYGILFICSLLCVYINLEYVRIRVICRVKPGGIRDSSLGFIWLAPQECVNTYSTRRVATQTTLASVVVCK